jgi:hypothetical protein
MQGMANDAEGKKRAPTVWVLDTETKGTGAEMIPLEKAQRRKSSQSPRERIRVLRRPSQSKDEPGIDELDDSCRSEEVRPRRFKLVNVLRRQVVAEDVGAREIVQALEGVPSIADVHIYVKQDAEEPWRLLTFAEKRAFFQVGRRVRDPE